MITVLVADDQDLVRAGLRALLGNDPELRVVAEARTGREAVDAAVRHRPDVVLMDLRMPDVDGIAATRRIRDAELDDPPRVLVLTTFDDDEDILAAVRAGAAGYVLKDTPADELRRAVHVVAGGGNLMSPQVTRRMMAHLAATPSAAPDLLAGLTGREREVLTRIAHGDTNEEIGAALHLSPATARTYVSRILAKLDARDRTELAVIAHRAGLYREPEPGTPRRRRR